MTSTEKFKQTADTILLQRHISETLSLTGGVKF